MNNYGLKFSAPCDEIKSKYVIPSRVAVFEKAENCEFLTNDNMRQTQNFGKVNFCSVKEGGYVVLDMGAEIHGGIFINFERVSEKKTVRVVFGESVSEALSTIGERNATNQHSVRDIVFDTEASGSVTFGNMGYRFVKIEAVKGDTFIGAVQGILVLRDIEYKGSFECNDEKINKIWKVGAYTTHLNMQEYLWDGIKRDRLVWMGDTHPEILTVCSVFGYNEVIPKSLDLMMNITPPEEWMNTIPTYTSWWIINHQTWYMQNGDKKYLENISDYLFKTVEHILSCVCEDGKLDYPKYFCDWSSRDTDDEIIGAYAVTILGLKAGCYLCGVLGNEDLAKKCMQAVKNLCKKRFEDFKNKQTASLYALAGGVDSKEISERLLKTGGSKGFSTFLGGYVLRTLHNGGFTEEAVRIMREYWGAMLDFGATTFWEDFDIDWVTDKTVGIDKVVPKGMLDIHGDCGKFCYTQLRHSLCHGWASGPTSFLSQKITGIEILEPGLKKVRINPALGGLEYIKTKYPTPYGCIEVEADLKGKKINAPKEIEIV